MSSAIVFRGRDLWGSDGTIELVCELLRPIVSNAPPGVDVRELIEDLDYGAFGGLGMGCNFLWLDETLHDNPAAEAWLLTCVQEVLRRLSDQNTEISGNRLFMIRFFKCFEQLLRGLEITDDGILWTRSRT